MIGTNLPGRVRNVSLAPSNGLMPLFEAVSNSIHAIEEAGRAPDEGRIRIEIKRSAPRLSLDPDVLQLSKSGKRAIGRPAQV